MRMKKVNLFPATNTLFIELKWMSFFFVINEASQMKRDKALKEVLYKLFITLVFQYNY
jgi:hypothetical protein